MISDNHSFVHLRVHSEYSVNEGAARLSDGGVVSRAAELGMPALGLADFGALFGAVKFYQSCCKNGIKPIIGCDVPVGGEEECHLLLLCADDEGYRTLSRLISRGYANNGGKIHRTWLGDDNRGLIVLSGGARGDIGRALRKGDEPAALAAAAHWKECFGDRFYVETWRATENDDGFAAAASIIAHKTGLPLTATHPVQCARAEDKQMLEIRRCIAHNWRLSDHSRGRPFADPPHLLSVADMQRRFADMPEALANSVEIAMRCNFAYSLGKKNHLPKLELGDETAAQAIVRMSQAGLTTRGLGGEEYTRRLAHELKIINQMEFADYYLIVADFVNWAKRQNIPVGPGRGSGAASLAAFALGITEINPLVHGLLFERFLNPERMSLPDFDIDFCVDGRDKVIEYVRDKYGADRVAQIVTFGQIGARSSVRDVGRVLGYPYAVSDRVARLIPGAAEMTLSKALDESPQLRQEKEDNDEVRELLELSQEVEGLPRNIGTHAGGVLIAPSPIVDFCPLYAAADTNSMVSQMDMKDIEQIGLVKFDFLGLKTLTILAAAEKILREINAVDENFSVDNIPMDDAKVYDIYARADTLGIFQCESPGMRRLMEQAKPDCFGDVVALIALFRPGPMKFAEPFTARKHGREAVTYPHPELEETLAETYGLWIYQEQVMETARRIAGYSLGEADFLRRAMGKKKPEEMEQQRQRFVEGAKEKMGGAKAAEKLFNKIADFAEYGFNKAHAAAYAIISYRTAHLKAYYPAALYAAVMSADAGDTDRLKTLADNARAANITLSSPDINNGRRDFYLADAGHIIYGLQAIKGIGGVLVDAIVQARGAQPFTNLFDFCRRLGGCKLLTQTAAENLIFAGAFDSIHPNRAAVRETLPVALEEADNQGAGLFGEAAGALADASPWDKRQTMLNEHKALGFAHSGSFYDLYTDFLRDADLRPKKLADITDESSLRIAGVYVGVKTPRALRQHGMEVILLEDGSIGELEIVVAADKLKTLGKLNERQDLLMIEGRVENNRGGRRVRAERLYTMESFLAKRAQRLIVRCDDNMSAEKLRQTLTPAQHDDGRCEVILDYEDRALRCEVSLGDKWRLGNLLYARLQECAPGVREITVEYRNVDT